jgi:transcriptional regulator with XRE-family HTH domain
VNTLEAGGRERKEEKAMSLRKISKILGISPTYLSLLLNGKRPWRGNLKERYEELVNTFVNTNNSLPETPSYSSIQAVYQLPAIKSWREREGVEPTAPTEGPGPTDLKSSRSYLISLINL